MDSFSATDDDRESVVLSQYMTNDDEDLAAPPIELQFHGGREES